MMNNVLKYRNMRDITNHSLLHLYTRPSVEKYTLISRTQLLAKWLKKRVNLQGYSSIKSDMKKLLRVAKEKKDIEAELWRISGMLDKQESRFSDAEHLYMFLMELYEQYGLCSQEVEIESAAEEEVLYMLNSEQKRCFNPGNCLTRPITVFIRTDEPQRFLERAQKSTSIFVITHLRTEDDIAYYSIEKPVRE